jgi:hypothetical protein
MTNGRNRPCQPTLPSPYRGEKIRLRGDLQGSARINYTHDLNRGWLVVYSPRIACHSDLMA